MNFRRRAMSLAATAALSLALVPTPVLAAAIDGCAPGGSGGDVLVGRDGAAREKDTGQQHKDLPARQGQGSGQLQRHRAGLGPRHHRRCDRQPGRASRSTPRSPSFDDGFITDNPVWYASRPAGAEHEMKKALKRGDDGTLNVYTTSGGAYLGWAYLPEITDTAQAYLDGIVIDWRTAPHVSDEYENEFDEGDTLTHEAGH